MLLIGFLISSLSLVAIPVASGETVTGLTIISPTTDNPAYVQPGGAVNITYQITVNRTDQDVLIQVTILKGSVTVGNSVTSKIEKTLSSTTLTVITNYPIPENTNPGKYDVRVRAKQPVGGGNWQQEVTIPDAVIVQSPTSVDTSLVLSIAPSSVVVGSSGPVVFYATLTRTDTGAGVEGATISFTVDEAVVGSATTNASGVATLNYNPSALTPGSHTVQASFAGQTIDGITFNLSTSNTQTLQVIYNFIGFLPPLGSGTFKAGSTIPVKFQLTDYYGNYISTATAQISVDSNAGTSSGSSNNGNYFRYDPTNNQYIFNLSTKGMSPGTYTITVTLDDGTTHSTMITLK